MTAPNFLDGSEPIETEPQQLDFLAGSESIDRAAPEDSFSRYGILQPSVGIGTGFFGALGSMADLLGIGVQWTSNMFKGRQNIEDSGSFATAAQDYFEGREEFKKGLPGQRIRVQNEAENFGKIGTGELSFTEQMALLMGDDDIMPQASPLANIQEIGQAVGALTNGFTDPKTANERIGRQTGEFIGATAFPMGRVAKGAELIAAGGGGLLSGVGREAGVGPMGELGLALLGTIATGSAVNLAKAAPAVAKNLATDFRATVGRGVAKVPFLKVTSKQLRNDVIAAAKAEGVELPLSAITDNEILRFLETQLAESSIAGGAIDKAREKLAKQYVSSVNRTFKEISKTASLDKAAAGAELKGALVDAEKLGAAKNRANYDLAESLIPQGDVTKAPNVVSKIDSLINRLEKTVKPSKEEASTLKYLKGLKDEFFVPVQKEGVQLLDARGNPLTRKAAAAVQKELPAQNLVGLRRSLNDEIDFVAQGGSKKLLRSLPGELEKDIEAYGKRNAEFLDAERIARAEFKEYAETFRNREIKNALRNETPEDLLNLGSKQSNIRKVEKALDFLGKEQGNAKFNQFRRAKVEDLIKDKIISPKDSQVSFRKASNMLNDTNKAAILKELAGPEGFKRLQNLQKIADGIVQGAEKFANPSRSGAKVADIAAYVYAVKSAAQSVSTGNPLPLVKAGFTVYAPKLMADMITDRAFIEQLIDAARKGKGTNAKAYLKSLGAAAATLQTKVIQLEKDERETPSI